LGARPFPATVRRTCGAGSPELRIIRSRKLSPRGGRGAPSPDPSALASIPDSTSVLTDPDLPLTGDGAPHGGPLCGPEPPGQSSGL
jgi:hypothetical protein